MDPSCIICDKGRAHSCKTPICLEKHVTPCVTCWRPICDQYPCSLANLGQGPPRVCMNCSNIEKPKN